MTHSQQPSINILKERISEIQEMMKNGSESDKLFYKGYIILLCQEAEKIEALPQEPTLEELLEELKQRVKFVYFEDGNYWKVYDESYNQGYGDSPKLALIELKEKLSTNKS